VVTKSKSRLTDKRQRGGSLMEFVFIAPFFLMLLVGIVAAGNFYFTHNAMVEATRRGARFAAMQAASNPAGTIRTTQGCDTTGPQLTAIKNYAIYGNSAGTGETSWAFSRRTSVLNMQASACKRAQCR